MKKILILGLLISSVIMISSCSKHGNKSKMGMKGMHHGASVALDPNAPVFVSDNGNIQISQAMIRFSPPGAPNTAGYLIVKNNSEQDITLQSVETDFANSNELHEMKNVDGKMIMRPLEGIEIPAGKEVYLVKGGLHLMFINLNKELSVDEIYPVKLTFSDGSIMNIEAKVIPIQ